MGKKKLVKIILIASIFLVIFSLVLVLYVQIAKKKEKEELPEGKTLEEIRRDFTAPQGTEPTRIPEEILKDFTAPSTETRIPGNIIKDFTAPQ